MDEAAVRAGAEAAKRKVKRADGLLRDAVRELAALAEGQDTLGILRAHDEQSLADARELIELGVARHGAVDVVVIARPTGRVRSNPTMAHQSGGDRNGTTHSETGS
jgi:hypothetical protein